MFDVRFLICDVSGKSRYHCATHGGQIKKF